MPDEGILRALAEAWLRDGGRGKRLLDLSCGAGTTARMLAAHGALWMRWAVVSWGLGFGTSCGGSNAEAGFRDAAELRRHTEGSGVRHPFAARGRMKLFGTTVAGAIRRLGRRMGP